MRKDMHRSEIVKRAACAGLFLGILCAWRGCSRPTVQPDVTNVPSPVGTQEPGNTKIPDIPETTKTPEKNDETGKPTKEPEMTPSLTPTLSPVPTGKPSASPVPTKEPEIPPTPVPGITPEPTPEATPILSVTVTVLPTSLPTETPLPLPTDLPDYGTLLQNGWQRTEDFFGKREIYFSGIFDATGMIAVPGRYEYRYTALGEAGVELVLIGEEEMSVELFLDELPQKDTDCLVYSEGEDDYAYSYSLDGRSIRGRVYACETDGKVNRMRVELICPSEQPEAKEWHEFYLK